MALFIWTDVLATGSPQTDDDHKDLIQKVNEVLEALADHTPNGPLAQALEDLSIHTREHFQREEEAMRLSKYPELMAHAAEHAHLLKQLRDIVEQLNSNTRVDAMAIYTLLTRWLIDHITNFDKKVT